MIFVVVVVVAGIVSAVWASICGACDLNLTIFCVSLFVCVEFESELENLTHNLRQFIQYIAQLLVLHSLQCYTLFMFFSITLFLVAFHFLAAHELG